MGRELVVLGTASQVPTRERNHNGYLLRWDGTGTLFDPGEGTQRQFLLAGVAVSAVTRICITHFHGDHCLGLPGVLQRCSLDGRTAPLTVAFPASGIEHFDRLRHASVFDDRIDVRPLPVFAPPDGSLVPVLHDETTSTTLFAAALDHRIDAIGWRVEERARRTMLPELLAAKGISGPDVGRLQREGGIEAGGARVALEEVSVPRPGQSMALVMDTRLCKGAVALAQGVDLLVCEATFADSERSLAEEFGHLTARQAGELAASARARILVLTHFSQRYREVQPLLDEAREVYPGEVFAVKDLDRVDFGSRRAV